MQGGASLDLVVEIGSCSLTLPLEKSPALLGSGNGRLLLVGRLKKVRLSAGSELTGDSPVDEGDGANVELGGGLSELPSLLVLLDNELTGSPVLERLMAMLELAVNGGRVVW